MVVTAVVLRIAAWLAVKEAARHRLVGRVRFRVPSEGNWKRVQGRVIMLAALIKCRVVLVLLTPVVAAYVVMVKEGVFMSRTDVRFCLIRSRSVEGGNYGVAFLRLVIHLT